MRRSALESWPVADWEKIIGIKDTIASANGRISAKAKEHGRRKSELRHI
jgi:hypothetical protein